MKNDLGELSAFRIVAQERSFTRAAVRLGVSQSALSHSIRGLERRLGLQLLARTTRSVSPTASGTALLQDLAPALEMAIARFRQIQSQKKEIDDLKDTIETRKLIERAKGILMDRHGMSEEEAFKRIHFQARNQNKKMKEIAQSIVTAADLI